MKFEISNETIEKTTECLRDFRCLDPDKGDICIDMCPIDQVFNKQILFLKDKLHENHCNYNRLFGFSYICNCPVRRDIYDLYKR
ncbi:MAG: hypothetical protein OEU95_02140 [Nitrospirota bacterium]|nr:hypothetical protein [Nitrospirota bacterium]